MWGSLPAPVAPPTLAGRVPGILKHRAAILIARFAYKKIAKGKMAQP
jgi:hypothetical protein